MNVFRGIAKYFRNFSLSMRMKVILSLSLIATSLLVSSILSVMEYTRMSDYVSELIAENIKSINIVQHMAYVSNEYNLEILSNIGDSVDRPMPAFDQDGFMAQCDSLKSTLKARALSHLADSVEYSYSAYMLTSLELPKVKDSDFIDTRSWYFERLQPVYGRLRFDIEKMSDEVYKELKMNSATFERGFYRSVIPAAVAVVVGLMLVVMFLFFILTYFVNPLYRMNRALKDYRTFNKKYSCTFEGDDQLHGLNEDITEITEENLQLRKRIKLLRESINQKTDNTPEQ